MSYSLIALDLAGILEKERNAIVQNSYSFLLLTFQGLKSTSMNSGLDKTTLMVVKLLTPFLKKTEKEILLRSILSYQIHAKSLKSSYATFQMIVDISTVRPYFNPRAKNSMKIY